MLAANSVASHHHFNLLHGVASDPQISSRIQVSSSSLETPTHLKLISRHRPTTTKIYTMSSSGHDPAGVPPPPSNNTGSRNAWLVGVVLAIAIPSSRSKLLSLKSLKDKFNAAVGTVEIVTHVVEEVAEEVERVADEIGNTLPDGPLKKVTDFIEVAADRTDKAAEFAGEVIDKVQAMEEEVSSYIESTILPRRRESAASKTAESHGSPKGSNESDLA